MNQRCRICPGDSFDKAVYKQRPDFIRGKRVNVICLSGGGISPDVAYYGGTRNRRYAVMSGFAGIIGAVPRLHRFR